MNTPLSLAPTYLEFRESSTHRMTKPTGIQTKLNSVWAASEGEAKSVGGGKRRIDGECVPHRRLVIKPPLSYPLWRVIACYFSHFPHRTHPKHPTRTSPKEVNPKKVNPASCRSLGLAKSDVRKILRNVRIPNPMVAQCPATRIRFGWIHFILIEA